MSEIESLLTTIAQTLSQYIKDGKQKNDLDMIRLEYNEIIGYHLSLTKRRSELLKKQLIGKSKLLFQINNTKYKVKPKELIYKIKGNRCRITSDMIRNKSSKIVFLKDKLQKSVQVEYLNLLERWSIEYEDLFTKFG